MSPVLTIVLAVITGGGFTAAVNAVVGRRRSKAEAGKIDADAAKIIAEAAAALVTPMSTRMGSLEQRVEVLEAENAHKTTLLDSAIRFIRDLLDWIGHRVPGEAPPDIPADLRAEVER
ncbi:hypothetical protein LCL87_25130 [Rhodococcus hoagii]|nr:hypothetical protein [Prescottella equi]